MRRVRQRFHGIGIQAALPTEAKNGLPQLTFVDRIILAYDNDEAGLRLARFLTKKLNNVVCVKQKYTKDVDDLLKTSYKDNYLEMLNNVIQKKSNTMNLF